MKAGEIKRGSVIEVDGAVVYITELQVQTASSRSGNTLYKVKGRNVVTRQKFQGSFKGDEQVQPVELERRPVQLLYQDNDGCTFMDKETYDQFTSARNKPATLATGLVVLVPEYLAQGETIKVNTVTGEFMSRA
jgi:elongation factor P